MKASLLVRTLFIILTLLGIGLITGCEQIYEQMPYLRPVTNDGGAVVPPTPSAQLPQPDINPTDLPASQEVSTITLWLPPQFDPQNGTPEGVLLEQQLTQFSADYPDITVDVRIKAVDGPGGLLETLTAASEVAPAVLPGIILLPRQDFEKAALTGLLMEVGNDELDASEYDWLPYADELTRIDGKRYGLPFTADVLTLAYKPAQSGAAPLTWQELIQKKALTAFPAAEPSALLPLLIYQSQGGGFTADETSLVLDPQALEAGFASIADASAASVFPSWLTELDTYGQSWQALLDSRSSYSLVWVSQYLEEQPEDISLIPLPAIGSTALTYADGWILAFPQTSPERYETFRILAGYLVDPEFQSAWTQAAGLLPPSGAQLASWMDSELSGILLEITANAQPLPSSEVQDRLAPLMREATIDLLQGRVSFSEAADQIIRSLGK